MIQKLYLLKDVSKVLRKRPHQVVYALTSGLVPDVSLRIGGKRIFQTHDLHRLANHFGVSLEHKDQQQMKQKGEK